MITRVKERWQLLEQELAQIEQEESDLVYRYKQMLDTVKFYCNEICLENVTLNLTGRFLKDKINATFNIGTQRNNLQKTEINTVRRIIGSVNLAYAPSPKWNFNATYSNFQTSTAIKMLTHFVFIRSIRVPMVVQDIILVLKKGRKE